MIKKYIAYIKDNPENHWFKAKLYGWGWVPVKWQGWLVIFVYIALISAIVSVREDYIPGNPDSGSNFLTFALPIIILTTLLITICYKKGEKPRWQWGSPKKDWSDYYKVTQSRPPRPLLIKALEFIKNKGKAIDMGGGALSDTKYLLDQGFEVTVIDKSPLMEKEAKNIPSNKLKAITTSFEEYIFPKEEYDIASAMFALPFTAPEHFIQVFKNIKNSLKEDGIFCGQFFGERDEWKTSPNMTFHTREQVEELFSDFEIVYFKEDEKDDKTATGGIKHWHIYHVIAKK